MVSGRAWVLAVAALLGGCASVGTVDDDPLTKLLGDSATTVQRVSEQASDSALRRMLRRADLRDVKRVNGLVEHLVAFEPQEVDLRELDAAIRNPDEPYAVAARNQRVWRGRARHLQAASISASAYDDSPDEVKSFIRHWNAYVRYWQQVTDSMADTLAKADDFKKPTTRFLKRVRQAIEARDEVAYRSAVEAYEDDLRTAGEGFFDLASPSAAGNQSEADLFTQLGKDANGSNEVGGIVQTLSSDYPQSVFAKRFSR